MKIETISVLIRGLCIDVTGKPHIVIYNGNDLAILENSMSVELKSNDSEEAASDIIRSVYNDWIKSNACEEGKVLFPACVELSVDSKRIGVYRIGEDIDSVNKNISEKKAHILYKKEKNEDVLININKRAEIVKNKIALVTGGAQGIGEEIARNLSAAGALVFIADMNLNGAKKLADQINEKEKRTAAIPVEVNVSSEESVEAMFNKVALAAGGLDICISNAGVLKAGSVLEQELSDFKFVTEINYTGFFIVSKFASRLIKTQHYSAPSWNTDIIQVNSKSGLEGSNKNGAYAGGKFGGLGLVASFAMELIEYGIKVNAVCPGNFLDGPLWSDPEKGLFVQYLKQGKVAGAKTIADVRAFYESKVPMRRGCKGKDLVRAIFYIIEQEYETGQAVPVTGGQIMLH